MPYYESIFIARQDISATQVDGLTESFTGIITEGGGQVTKKEYWGLRSLSYRIKKNRKGHYVLLNIDGPSSAVQEMERNMRISEDVIRYLTIRVDELEAEESVILRQRGSRDSGRGGRRGDRWGPRSDDRREDRRDGPSGGDKSAGSKPAESKGAESKGAQA